MWTCPLCDQRFLKINQAHSCNDKLLSDFFARKNPHCLHLFNTFTNTFNSIGPVTVHPTKTMIAFAATRRMAYLTRVGKESIDITFIFDTPYHDNLCFHRIAQVPGTRQFNHHFRMYAAEDLNEEVVGYMKLLYRNNS